MTIQKAATFGRNLELNHQQVNYTRIKLIKYYIPLIIQSFSSYKCKITNESILDQEFNECLTCLTGACQVMIGRFPKLCFDIAKENIKNLWICAYTECARGHQIHEETMREDCAQLCQIKIKKK